MQQVNIFIGVDVAKAELVLATHGSAQRPQALANNAQAIAAWLEGLPRNAHIAMESTGRYHGLLAHLSQQAGFKVYVLNARDVHYYAKALGTRGKTDSVDSTVIARYLGEHHASLHEWAGSGTLESRLTELLSRRAKVATHRAALRQVMDGLKGLDQAAALLQEQLGQFLDRIDQEVQRLIAGDAKLASGCARLQTITGIGPQTSALLGALFCRIEFANSDALVAYSGLDPRPHDSGTRQGTRRLSKKGPPLLRRQLWLAGFAASHSKALKPLYRSLRDRGLSSTEAIVVLARKLLRVAYSVWKGTERFDLNRIGPAKA